jgi:hypothetical protein
MVLRSGFSLEENMAIRVANIGIRDHVGGSSSAGCFTLLGRRSQPL